MAIAVLDHIESMIPQTAWVRSAARHVFEECCVFSLIAAEEISAIATTSEIHELAFSVRFG